MTSFSPLELSCCALPKFNVEDWDSIAEAFESASSCSFAQAWRKQLEADFQPTHAHIGWRENALWLYAELDDVDIFNTATQLNQDTYLLGDVLELFLRPVSQQAYYELHVTPNNQQLQLRWPNAHAVYERRGLSRYYISGMLQSYTNVQNDRHRWRLLAAVPAEIAESKTIEKGDVWSFSFCRYDYTHGRRRAVLSSSTSYDPTPNFHNQQNWGKLTFVTK